jgi:cytoskeletal protein CcmA (bactofilin family)
MLDRTGNMVSKINERWIAVAVLMLLLLPVSVVSGSAQSARDEMLDLRSELDAVYEVLPLSDGWLLKPLDPEAGFRVVEVSGSELAIDGTVVSRDEVRARLGGIAEPVIAFADLGSGERENLMTIVAQESDDTIGEQEVRAEESALALEKERAQAVEEREAREENRRSREVNRTDAQVVVGSSVTIESDEVTRGALVIGGSLTSYGLVKGDAVAIGGPVEIYGEVTGDVLAVGGSVDLESGARVEGDVVSVGGSVDRDDGAIVEGEIQQVPFLPPLKIGGWKGPDVSVEVSPVRYAFGFAWKLFWLAVLVLFAALTLLVARQPVERVGRKVAEEPWKSGLVGLLSQILIVPLLIVLIVILVISIVGIPFLLLLPFAALAVLLIFLMGYTAVAVRLGRWAEDRFGWSFASPFLVLLVGIGLLEIWSLIGELLGMGPGPIKFFAVMFAIFGGLVTYAAWTVGFGGAVISRLGATPRRADGGNGGGRTWQQPADDTLAVSDLESAAETFATDTEDDSPSDWRMPDADEPESRD